MKKLLSTGYSAGAFSFAILVLRLGLGILMMHQGYEKLVYFGTLKNDFISFLGMGSTISLALVVFAEFFCSLFLVIGLFTRIAAIPLIITMGVALFKSHHGDIFSNGGEKVTLYLVGFIVLLFVGAGRVSVDSMIGK